MAELKLLDAARLMNSKGVLTMATELGLSRPISVRCVCERANGLDVTHLDDYHFTNWPQNFDISVARYYKPVKRADVVAAILDAEKSGRHVRALGSGYSFSDVIWPIPDAATKATADQQRAQAIAQALANRNYTEVALIAGTPLAFDDALVDTTGLNHDLCDDLPLILGDRLPEGVDPNYLIHVGAGMTLSGLITLLDLRPGRQTLDAVGGAPLTTLAGCISTGTHGGDSRVPPLADHILAIHLIGARGIEYWIEPKSHITNPARLGEAYPCLSHDNIIYDDDTFHAVLVSMGSMGIIYSLIVRTVPPVRLGAASGADGPSDSEKPCWPEPSRRYRWHHDAATQHHSAAAPIGVDSVGFLPAKWVLPGGHQSL